MEIPQNSDAAPAKLARAADMLAKKDYRGTHALCLEVLREDPSASQAYYLLGILAADHANHAKAVELFDRALSGEPDGARIHAQRARSLIALNQRENALSAIKRATAAAPTDAFTLDTIGVVYSRAGLHTESIPFYEQATAANPDNSGYFYNYGAALQFAGKMDAARDAYQTCLALDPTQSKARAALVQITRQTPEDNNIAELESAFPDFSDSPDDALRIGHSIAKAYEDIGDAKAAFSWLTKAKAPKKTTISYAAEADIALFDAAKKTVDTVRDRQGYRGAAPIFIVGMPRTGTTLVDRILSSHSEVTSAGELTDFGLCLKRLSGTQSNYVLDPETLAAAAGVPLETLGQKYMDSVQRTLNPEGRFIDKMPLNAFYSALIAAALPGARIICLRRHPADTVLSNFRQLFATSFSYYNYAYDLEDTARYYVAFSDMIDTFSARLPADRFIEVHYESIVTNQELETRRLLDFCNLPFEQACLEFHKNAAPVATASSAQVREPLYTRSLARWKRYEESLAPALDILQDAGVIKADERG